MKLSSRLLAVSLLAFAAATVANAARRGNLDLIAIAETTAASRDLAAASSSPVSYVAVQGGYIEAGDPVAGERPPEPEAVAGALRSALSAQNFTAAAAGTSPQLIVTYHWGVIRPDSLQLAPASGLKPNLKARLSLVARQQLVEDIERDLVAHRYTRSPRLSTLIPSHRDALEWARDRRYFVVVSAYRYDELAKGNPVLVWRTRLSAADNSGSMNEVVPALLAAGAPQFGRDLRRADLIRVRFPSIDASPATDPSLADPHLARLDRSALQQLVRDERLAFSGENAWEMASAR